MDDDRKSKWAARSTQVGGKEKNEKQDPPAREAAAEKDASVNSENLGSSNGPKGAAKQGAGEASSPPPATRPGAVAVAGPGILPGDADGAEVGSSPLARRGDVEDGEDGGGVVGEDGAGDNADIVMHVESYAVQQSHRKDDAVDDDEIRRRILASTERAEEVVAVPSQAEREKKSRQRCWLAGIAAVIVAAAIAAGIAVPLASQQQSTSDRGPDSDVIASVTYMELQGSGGFAYAVQAETRGSYASNATSGTSEMVWCRPRPCLESDENCALGEYYKPGCCLGSNCTDDLKCGEYCPVPPESCYLSDPSNTTCLHPECYTCNQVEGEDVYVINYFAYSIDCLEVGTAVRPENGETYQWAIFCGPVIAGPKVEENRDLGEYQCGAFRIGARYSDDDEGVQAASVPCQFIALAECGCGPADMYTFGLPDPTGPCMPESGCPYLCEDAGLQYARNLCRSFPGNISWWEGQNVFNSSFFLEDVARDDYQLEIYRKGFDAKV